MNRKISDGLFVAGIVLVLAAGLVRTAAFPKDINSYENRYAEKLPVSSLCRDRYIDLASVRIFNGVLVYPRHGHRAGPDIWVPLPGEF